MGFFQDDFIALFWLSHQEDLQAVFACFTYSSSSGWLSRQAELQADSSLPVLHIVLHQNTVPGSLRMSCSHSQMV